MSPHVPIIPWRQETHRLMKSTNCFASLAVDGTPTMITAVTPSKSWFLMLKKRNVKLGTLGFQWISGSTKSMVEIPNPSKSIDLCCFLPQVLRALHGPKMLVGRQIISSFCNGPFLCHMLIFGGENISNIQKNPRPLVGKVAGESPVAESAKLGSKVNHGTEFAPEKMNMKSIEIWFVFTLMTSSIEYKVSFELWIISSSFILNCCIPRLGSTLISHESMLPFGPAVKRLPLSAASKFWRIFLRTWHTSRGARYINIYHP